MVKSYFRFDQLTVFFCAIFLAGLSGCNSPVSGVDQSQNPAGDRNPEEIRPTATPSCDPTHTPTPTPTGTVTPTPTPTVTTTPSPTPTVTGTPTPTPTVTVIPTPTPTTTVTPSPTPTVTSTPTTNLYTGPAEVAKYVQKFIDDGKIQGVDVLPDMKNPKLEVRIASLDAYGPSVIGLCESSGSRRRVTFDPDFWNTVSETQKEILAHHEFGHCILYRAHRSDLRGDKTYASIMYPVIMSSTNYLNNYAYYQEELYTYGAMEPTNEEVVHVCDIEDLGFAPKSTGASQDKAHQE